MSSWYPTSTRGSATFEFWADQPNAITQCSLDGLPWEPCSGTVRYTHLEAGDHDLQVQAMSAFGLPPAMLLVFVATILAGSLAAIHYVVVHILMGRPFGDEVEPAGPEGVDPESSRPEWPS
jgi:hypothetical protein